MQWNKPVGKEWAKSILSQGYNADKKDQMTTYAKVLNKKTGQMETVEFKLGKTQKHKCNFKRWFVR